MNGNVYDISFERNKKRLKKWFFIISALVILLIIVAISIGFILELIQINEIGKNFVSIFWKNFWVKILTQIISLIIVFLLFFITNIVIKKNIQNISKSFIFIRKNIINFIVSFIIALIASNYFEKALYIKFLTWVNSKPFNIKDPIFNKDIGYYVFERPFNISLVGILLFLFVLVTIYTLVIYFAANAQYSSNRWDIFQKRGVRLHIIVNVLAILILELFTFRYKMEGLLYSFFGEVVGIGYTDYYIRLNYFRIAIVLMSLVILLSMYFIFKKQYINVLKMVGVYLAFWLIGNLIAYGFQYFIVSPNELAYERPFLAHNIKYTREAYNINDIKEENFQVDTQNPLTQKDILNNKPTIDNVRITDFPTTLTIQNQIQRFKQYYIFNDADIAKYTINGKTKAVFISAREINYDGIPTKTYINQHFQYTHGYGIVMSPLSDITPEGQPKFIIKDIPVVSLEGAPEVNIPQIYYGESTNQYVIVNSKEAEIDYPEGDTNKTTRYNGKGGIRLTFFNRALFSYIYKDFRLFISSAVDNNSKLLINRNIIQRVQKVAPFFMYDDDPYILVDSKGKLFWVLDAYTTTPYFPYSEPTEEGFNYIRNSVKVIIDAYNGTVKFYIIDKNDPIVKVYKSIYPELFESGDIPEDLQEHIRYPEKIFQIQADMLRRYHMTNTNVFYNKEDLWDIGKHKIQEGEANRIPPYYSVVRLPKEDKEEMILMVPFTPLKYNTMIAWLAARCEKDDYGKMILYKFPKGSTVYGPMQIENMIDQDPQISKDLSLWNQGGSRVIRGNLLILPIDNKLLYIEPIYIASDNTSALPEVKRVIASFNGKVVMGDNLTDAISKLIGEELITEEKPTQTPTTTTQDQTEIYKIKKLFEELKELQKQGKWDEWGKKFKELDEVISSIK